MAKRSKKTDNAKWYCFTYQVFDNDDNVIQKSRAIVEAENEENARFTMYKDVMPRCSQIISCTERNKNFFELVAYDTIYKK